MRNTTSLLAIRNYLQNTDVAISAVELVDHFSDRFNKTTIYRVLTRLENVGEIHSVLGNDANTYYATCSSTCSEHDHNHNHVHKQCKKCGELSCTEVQLKTPETDGFKVEEARVLLVGLCKNCQ
ncbi:Fur family transcriptional regulator, ferric uptake regulator [Tenacibaculum sp. MAR_2009_124]|uniref:Fur family transcriptional regulator n=1 Tax=Tenacibaculum sp. MAR_2009_124 TaxID=1250059 RepID=UPI000899CFDD|nr:transcriptional repressor [Tenacibaculum sp. MAR_2009_124]SEB96890.1 Fur family transcriptional regulator, ferric uptake regulator [Tenacibaculum sp. MAR_2009_124]